MVSEEVLYKILRTEYFGLLMHVPYIIYITSATLSGTSFYLTDLICKHVINIEPSRHSGGVNFNPLVMFWSNLIEVY